MGKFNRMKLIKGTSILLLTGFLGVTSFDKDVHYTNQFAYNVNSEFEEELQRLNNIQNIQFNNEELSELISRRYSDSSKSAYSIQSLYFERGFKSSDFSDLKYFQGLKTLAINNNEVDLKELQYNQNLTKLTLNNCTLKNTSYLPNTIEQLTLKNCKIEGDLIIPYSIQNLRLENLSFDNIGFKNIQSLNTLYIVGDMFLDINLLRNASNLNTLYIEKCSNVKNARILKELNIQNLTLDDYAPIWMVEDDFYGLNYNSKFNIEEETKELDKIAKQLKSNNLSDVDSIIEYVLNDLTYDMKVYNNSDASRDLIKFYNMRPVQYALLFDEGIHISYAVEFMALANRLGIDNYMQYSDNYTWNVANQKILDLTKLDFPEYQNANMIPINNKPTTNLVIEDIGYIKSEKIVKISFNKERFILNAKGYALAVTLIELLYFIYYLSTKKVIKKSTVRKNKKIKKDQIDLDIIKLEKEIEEIRKDKLKFKSKKEKISKIKSTPKKKVFEDINDILDIEPEEIKPLRKINFEDIDLILAKKI